MLSVLISLHLRYCCQYQWRLRSWECKLTTYFWTCVKGLGERVQSNVLAHCHDTHRPATDATIGTRSTSNRYQKDYQNDFDGETGL